MLSIIILDNYPILRYGVAKLLKNHFIHVQITEIPTAENITHSVYTLNPDVIILGINDNLVKKDLKLYFDVKHFFPNTPIIIYDEVVFGFKTLPYLEFGIQGYLLKKNNSSELIRSVEIVLSGSRYVCLDVVQNLFYDFLLEEPSAARKDMLLGMRQPLS